MSWHNEEQLKTQFLENYNRLVKGLYMKWKYKYYPLVDQLYESYEKNGEVVVISFAKSFLKHLFKILNV